MRLGCHLLRSFRWLSSRKCDGSSRDINTTYKYDRLAHLARFDYTIRDESPTFDSGLQAACDRSMGKWRFGPSMQRQSPIRWRYRLISVAVAARRRRARPAPSIGRYQLLFMPQRNHRIDTRRTGVLEQLRVERSTARGVRSPLSANMRSPFALPAGSALMFDVVADPVLIGGSRLNAGRFHDFQERLHSGR
jgi:hypothetical protein